MYLYEQHLSYWITQIKQGIWRKTLDGSSIQLSSFKFLPSAFVFEEGGAFFFFEVAYILYYPHYSIKYVWCISISSHIKESWILERKTKVNVQWNYCKIHFHTTPAKRKVARRSENLFSAFTCEKEQQILWRYSEELQVTLQRER